jgi:hypothetical protein
MWIPGRWRMKRMNAPFHRRAMPLFIQFGGSIWTAPLQHAGQPRPVVVHLESDVVPVAAITRGTLRLSRQFSVEIT